MTRRLPPLNGLRAFEAAARHLSFTNAADELNVTQAAVSHQVKGLEQFLGRALFRRLNRALELTEAGQVLFPAVRDGLDLMAGAVRRLEAGERENVLTVSTLDSLAATWLVPRLGGFRARHPDIELRLLLSDAPVDFARDDVDVAIRYGRGRWPGLRAERLMGEEVFPVASPKLLEDGPPLDTPADLANYPVVHDRLEESWADWMAAAGAPEVNMERGPRFEHSNLVIQAVLAGDGVALGRSVLVQDALAAGHLVRLFDISLPASHAFWFVAPPDTWDRAKVRAFREWLLDEARGPGCDGGDA